MKSRAIILTSLFLLNLACLGCGNSNGLNPVHGKVCTRTSLPSGAHMSYFHRQGSKDALHEQTPMGVIEEDGTFQLAGPEGQGAPAGDYVVLIEWKEGPANSSRSHRSWH